jgi:Skp family chaperone for outer membrane proteins
MRPLWSDTVGPPTLLGMSADNREPSRPDLDAAPDERSAPPAQPPEAAPQHRPTGWIVLSCVLALAVVGLAVWAFSAKSDADDAEAALKAQARAEATPTPTPTAAPQPAEVDAATQQEFEQVQEDLGATTESVDEIEQDLDQAEAKVDEAEQAQKDASGELDGLKAELEAATAQFELSRTCMRGTLSAVGAAFEGGGLEAAVQELQKLAGTCRSAASS